MMHTPNHRAILSTGRPAPLPSPPRASVARMLAEDPPIGVVERCLALLLTKGIAGDELAALCGLTRAQLRDALESIDARIAHRQARLKHGRKLRKIRNRVERTETAPKRPDAKPDPEAGERAEGREG